METLAELDAEALAPELLVDDEAPAEPLAPLDAEALTPEWLDDEPPAEPLAPLEAEVLGPLVVAPVALRPCCGAPASTSYGASPSSRALLPHPSTTPRTASAAIGRRIRRFFFARIRFALPTIAPSAWVGSVTAFSRTGSQCSVERHWAGACQCVQRRTS